MLNLTAFIQKIKSIYHFFKKGHLIIMASAIFLLCLSAYLGMAIALKAIQIKAELAQSNDTLGKITVIGEGQVSQKPDLAIITLGITQEAKDPSEVQLKVSRIMNHFIDSLQPLKILAKDIKTTNYSLYPRYQYNPKTGARHLAAYVLNESIEVRVTDFHKLGLLLKKAADLGLNEASELKFGFKDNIAIKNKARLQAIDNAQRKARLLAQQLGVKLDKLIDFQESDISPPLRYSGTAAFRAAEDDSMPRVEPGSNKIKIKVTLTYRIK